ncbi:MAG: NUDIX domain-containing protein [Caldisericia bacterium]
MRYELAATTFVFNGNRFAIHFHEKVKKWLPPGGHVEVDELPHEAAVREVMEEAGVSPRLVVAGGEDLAIQTVPMPIAILVEDIDQQHKHIDMIHVATTETEKLSDGFKWVTVQEAQKLPAPEDVIRLAKKGLEILGLEE